MTREKHKEQWKNYHPLDIDVNDVIDSIFDDIEKHNSFLQDTLEDKSKEDITYMLIFNIQLNRSLMFKIEKFKKEKLLYENKLKKAKSYIVDLENQLKNKSNVWVNK